MSSIRALKVKFAILAFYRNNLVSYSNPVMLNRR